MPTLNTFGSARGFGRAGAAAPAQVTGLTATNVGSGRAYNNGRIDLAWIEPANNGATISGYKIERSTDGSTYSTLVANTGTTSVSYSDTGLSSNQIYYYRVAAINAVGTGLNSTAANATATTVPQAPTIGTASDGGTGTTASVTFTGNATGGSAITGYTATSSPGSVTGTSASSPITVSGLSGGTSYTFTVTATNANGTSAASAASNSVLVAARNGYFNTGGNTTTIQRVAFSTNTFSTTAASVSVPRTEGPMNLSNSTVAGYIGGGVNPGDASLSSSINKLTFSGESMSTLSATIVNPIRSMVGVSNRGVAGYRLGGFQGIGSASVNTVDKLTFSNDTVSNLGGILPSIVRSAISGENSGTAGYSIGGVNSGGDTSSIYKIAYSNDSVSTLGQTLQSARRNGAGISNKGSAAYALGGVSGGASNTIDKITFSNDSTSRLSATISAADFNNIGLSNNGSSGYALGGENNRKSANQFTFSNETVANLGNLLALDTRNVGTNGMSDCGAF